MLIGKTSTFAIEFELDENPGGEWLFGKVCYWINGHRVGDYELGTSLRDVLFQMSSILKNCGNRLERSLYDQEPKKIFDKIDGFLYGNSEIEGDLDSGNTENYSRFDIRIPVDAFDSWKIYLVTYSGKALFVYKSLSDNSVFSYEIKEAEFDSAICDFHAQLESEFRKVSTGDR